MNKEHTVYKNWGWKQASDCKMVFKASPNLNGKLIVRLDGKDSADVHVFKMPRNFNDKYGF